jgi:hypothetical protein
MGESPSGLLSLVEEEWDGAGIFLLLEKITPLFLNVEKRIFKNRVSVWFSGLLSARTLK